MIVEQVPDFLSSPQNDYVFYFDKDGRFIYMWKYTDEDALIFTVYDIFVNRHIELTGDSSISTSSEIGVSPDSTYKLNIRSFVPIDAQNVLSVLPANHINNSHILVFIRFDFKQKTYGIVDRFPMQNCQHPTLVRDGDCFGLFHMCFVGGEGGLTVGLETQQYALWTFTIQADRINLDLTNKKLFNYHPTNPFCNPQELHLRRNKLWFFHRKDVSIQSAMPFRQPRSSRNPAERNALISYFDLSEECPKERHIHEIHLSLDASAQPGITALQWTQDTLFLKLTKTTFDLLNLSTHEWKLDAFECSQFYAHKSFSNTNEAKKPRIEEEEDEWVEFAHNNDPNTFWTEFVNLHVDNHYFLVAVNRKSRCLHRVKVKNPPKLLDFAWFSMLNTGFFGNKTNLPMKLPYLPMF